MSAITVGGRRYAAGLYWLSRGGARQTARAARRLGRPWCVHDGERTGFAEDGGGGSSESLHPAGSGPKGLRPAGVHLEGVPALALALKAHIEGGFWMALVGGDCGGGEGRYALVKARGGAVLADGDEVFGDRAAAIAAFERARELGWALYATPGLAAELSGPGSEVAALDVAGLDAAAAAAGGAIELAPASPARGRRRLLPAALGLAVLAAGGAWLEREALMDWLAPPPPVPEVWGPEPTVSVAVDGAALIAACRKALIENPPFLPAWRIEGIACAARFADPALTSLRPELAGRPVLLVRWHLAAGHRGTPWSGEALQRRLAEAHLARWHAASVADGRAWAAMPLGPVLRIADLQTPSFLELRRAVDRTFGAERRRRGLRARRVHSCRRHSCRRHSCRGHPCRRRGVDGADRRLRAAGAAGPAGGRHRRAGDHRAFARRSRHVAAGRKAHGTGDGAGIGPGGPRRGSRSDPGGSRAHPTPRGGRRWNARA